VLGKGFNYLMAHGSDAEVLTRIKAESIIVHILARRYARFYVDSRWLICINSTSPMTFA
jgi:hypothetical protein